MGAFLVDVDELGGNRHFKLNILEVNSYECKKIFLPVKDMPVAKLIYF
jgi:hypothetical protein